PPPPDPPPGGGPPRGASVVYPDAEPLGRQLVRGGGEPSGPRGGRRDQEDQPVGAVLLHLALAPDVLRDRAAHAGHVGEPGTGPRRRHDAAAGAVARAAP